MISNSYNNVSCKKCNSLISQKLRILFDLIKTNWDTIHAYLKSKEIWDDLIVKPIFVIGDYIEASVRSRTSDEVYTVIINFKKDVYYCTCNSYIFKRYLLEIPEQYKDAFWRGNIALCPHILKVIEFILRKYCYFSTK